MFVFCACVYRFFARYTVSFPSGQESCVKMKICFYMKRQLVTFILLTYKLVKVDQLAKRTLCIHPSKDQHNQ